MKKLTASIIGLILCTSPVLASAKDTCCLSKDELLNQIKNQVEDSVNKISLEELLNKFDGCLNLPEIPGKPETEKPENSTPSLPEEKPENTPNEETSFEIQVLNLVNIERTQRGLSPLSYSYELEAVAKAHSNDMAQRNYFSHNSPEGKTPFDRIKNAGISYKSAGENIAAGQKTPEEVVNGWMNSSGHRANILNSNYTKMGIGVVYGGSYGIYWTQLFTG